MTSDIWVIDWNNYLDLHQKAKHGDQIAEKTLKKVTKDFNETGVITPVSGYMISCNGIIQKLFNAYGREAKITQEPDAHNLIKVLREKNKTLNFSVISF